MYGWCVRTTTWAKTGKARGFRCHQTMLLQITDSRWPKGCYSSLFVVQLFACLSALAVDPPARQTRLRVRALKVAIHTHLQGEEPDFVKCRLVEYKEEYKNTKKNTSHGNEVLPFIRSGQNHLTRHSERGNKTSQTEKEVGRHHQGMARPGGRQVPVGSGVQEKNGGNWLWCHLWCLNDPSD